MRFSRFILIIILLLLGIGTIIIINYIPSNILVKTNDTKPIIVATLFPFYDIARTLASDQADISLLLPPGIEPHSFEPTPQDIIRIQEANIFIYSGDSMEPWAKDIISNLPKTVTVIDASSNINLIRDISNTIDPHFWLDFNNTIIATNTIAQALSQTNSIDNTIVNKNNNILIQNLTQLDTDYRETLSKCHNKTIIQAGHRTFGYLSKRYNLTYITTEELSPNSDTSAKDIAKIIDEIRKEKAKAIFSEELIEPRIAQTISDETGVPILLLNGAHNITSDQLKSNISFLNIMRDNLKNLSIGLDCK